MPSKRTLILVVAAIGAVAVVVIAGVLIARDDPPPASGDLIAYGCKELKNPWYALCTVRPDGTEGERLTRRLPTTDPAWSPDGRRIAFTRNEDTGESTTFTHDDVFVMDADGSDVRQLTPDKEGRSLSQPTWSPDGRQLAYVDGESVQSAVPSRYGDLFVIADDGSGTRRLTTGPVSDPDWSPDGREVTFVRGKNLSSPTEANDDIHVLNLATGAARQLTRTGPGTYEAAPAWSPDGSRVAFVRWSGAWDLSGMASVNVVNRDGTGERLVVEYPNFGNSPHALAWSPDGSTIAFETPSAIGCTTIALVDVRSGDVRPLTTCERPSESAASPAWQPDAAAKDR